MWDYFQKGLLLWWFLFKHTHLHSKLLFTYNELIPKVQLVLVMGSVILKFSLKSYDGITEWWQSGFDPYIIILILEHGFQYIDITSNVVNFFWKMFSLLIVTKLTVASFLSFRSCNHPDSTSAVWEVWSRYWQMREFGT